MKKTICKATIVKVPCAKCSTPFWRIEHKIWEKVCAGCSSYYVPMKNDTSIGRGLGYPRSDRQYNG